MIELKQIPDSNIIIVTAKDKITDDDKKSIRRSIKAFGFLMPGEVKLFKNDELADAEAWIAE